MKAYLILEDGHIFEGESFGIEKEVISEFVFNTSMTGYTEILTDPSYAGQSVVMTYPLIGNYGVSYKDQESSHPFVEGFVIHELSRLGSNFRMNMSLNDYMIENNIPGIQGVDTRAIAKILRTYGCMNGMITTNKYQINEVIDKIKNYKVKDVVERCSCDMSYKVGKGKYKVALLDLGMKRNIAKELVKRDCTVTVYPSNTSAKEIIENGCDGIMLSNGPGNPEDNKEVIKQIQLLSKSGIPIFAICLGHQLIALAQGMKTEKLKFGHHGVNHPVRDNETNRVYISSQNHNYVVSDIDNSIAKVWFENVNDGTIEGLKYNDKPIRTVQFHPEANAGPQDTSYLFDEFIQLMGE